MGICDLREREPQRCLPASVTTGNHPSLSVTIDRPRSRFPRFVASSPDLSSGLMAGAERQRAPFVVVILASGYDSGPAVGPGGRGSTGPGLSFLVAGTASGWSGGLRERVDALPRGRDRLGPRPGGLDLQAAPPPAADQAGGGVQDAVAQRLGLGPGEVAVQGQELEP